MHSASWMAALAVLSKLVKVGYGIHACELSSVAHYEHEPHAATAAPQSSRFVPWILLWDWWPLYTSQFYCSRQACTQRGDAHKCHRPPCVADMQVSAALCTVPWLCWHQGPRVLQQAARAHSHPLPLIHWLAHTCTLVSRYAPRTNSQLMTVCLVRLVPVEDGAGFTGGQ